LKTQVCGRTDRRTQGFQWILMAPGFDRNAKEILGMHGGGMKING